MTSGGRETRLVICLLQFLVLKLMYCEIHQVGVVLHKMMHHDHPGFPGVVIRDHAYRYEACLRLVSPGMQKDGELVNPALNADTFRMFASFASLGCSEVL